MSLLAVAMGLPAIADLATGNPDWQVFAGSAAVSLFVGVSLMLTTRSTSMTNLNLRQAFLLTTMSWVAVAAVGALPFAFSELEISVADAFFESMSGITTTGSTIIVGLDNAPPGILLWRALLQWLGGVGIIVMAMAMLPILSVGGMQLFRTEAFDTPDKVLPRAAHIAGGIFAIYLFMTGVCALALWTTGFSGFDAIAHAMTTIATGGYSTKDDSIGYFNNPIAEWIIICGMIIGSLPFLYYLRVLRGNLSPIMRDSQVRWFFIVIIASVFLVTCWVWNNSNFGPNLSEGFASILEIYPNNDLQLIEDINRELNSINQKIGQRKKKETQKTFHGYSRLLDLERLLYLIKRVKKTESFMDQLNLRKLQMR